MRPSISPVICPLMPIDEVAIPEVFVQAPAVGDGIAQENHARIHGLRRRKLRVGIGVAVEIVTVRRAKLQVALRQQLGEIGIETAQTVAQLRQLLPSLLGEIRRLRQRVRHEEKGANIAEKNVIGRQIRGGPHVSERLPRILGKRSARPRQLRQRHAG